MEGSPPPSIEMADGACWANFYAAAASVLLRTGRDAADASFAAPIVSDCEFL